MTVVPRIEVIWAHPRAQSLAATIAGDAVETLGQGGADVDVLDLCGSGFAPVLREPDEPDGGDLDKRYSDEVMGQAERMRGCDAVVFVFPAWSYSFPAIMKGFIDRVWNNGLFYGGGRRSGLEAVRWIGLAGEAPEAFAKRGYDTAHGAPPQRRHRRPVRCERQSRGDP